MHHDSSSGGTTRAVAALLISLAVSGCAGDSFRFLTDELVDGGDADASPAEGATDVETDSSRDGGGSETSDSSTTKPDVLVDEGLETKEADAGELGASFTAAFKGGEVPTAQCASWNAFRAKLSSTKVYSKITISGTFDLAGVSCAGADANTICQAIRANTPITLPCGGQAWRFHACGGSSGLGLTLGDLTCSACPNPIYAVHPCADTDRFGGIKTASCPPPSQTLTVVCD